MQPSPFPHVPAFFFLRYCGPAGKRLLLVATLALAAIVVLVGLSTLDPWFWVLHESLEVTEHLLPSPILEAEGHNRTMKVTALVSVGVYHWQPGPLMAGLGPLLVGHLAMLLGWALALAASTKLVGWRAWVVPALWVLGLLSGNLAQNLFGTDPARVFSLLLALPVLLPHYVFQRSNTASLSRQVLFFGVVQLVQVGALALLQPQAVVHNQLASGAVFSGLCSLLVVVFLGKEPWLLLLLLGTNARNPRRRLAPHMLLGIHLAVVGLAVWALALRVGWLQGQTWLPPLLLAAPLALGSVVLAQNAYHRYSGALPSNLAYSAGVMGLLLLGLGGWFRLQAAFEYDWLVSLEVVFLLSIIGHGIGQQIYTLYNFNPYLKRKTNLFFAYFRSSVFPYWLVWVFTAIVVYAGVQSAAKVYRPQPGTLQLNQQADAFLRQGQYDSAYAASTKAALNTWGDPKSNHNALWVLANHARRNSEAYTRMLVHLKSANLRLHHEPALLLATLAFRNRPGPNLPAQRLRAVAARHPSAKTWLNLASLHFAQNQLDTARLDLIRSIEANDRHTPAYANLAALYLLANNPKEASLHLKSGSEIDATALPLLHNQLALDLMTGNNVSLDALPPPDPLLPTEHGYALNWGLLAARLQHYTRADAVGRDLERQLGEHHGVLLLRIMSQLGLDSLANAESRAQYVNINHPEQAVNANRIMAGHYLAKGMPELASAYMERNAELLEPGPERNRARQWVAVLEADAGRLRLGFDLLNNLLLESPPNRPVDPELLRELDLMRWAAGQEALVKTNMDSLSYDEAMRTGRYAAQLGQFSNAVQAYQLAVRLRDQQPEPYLELAAACMRYDSLCTPGFAREQLEAGLQKTPKRVHPVLHGQLALLLARENLASEAQKHLNALPDTHPVALQAKAILLGHTQPLESARQLQHLLKKHPLNKALATDAARACLRSENPENALKCLDALLSVNKRDPDLWLIYAQAHLDLANTREASAALEFVRSLQYLPRHEKERIVLEKRLAESFESNNLPLP